MFHRIEILILLIIPARCFGAITHAGTPTAAVQSAVTSKAINYTPATLNDLLLMFCYAGSGAGTTLTMSNTPDNFTWTQFQLVTSGNNSWAAFWAKATTTNAQSITCSKNGGTAFMSLGVDEFNGTDTSSPIDVSSGTAGTITGCTTVSSMTVNGELGWSALEDSFTSASTISGNAATKGADDASGDAVEYFIFSSGSGFSVDATFNGSAAASTLCITAGIKPFSAAASSVCTPPFCGIIGGL